VKEVFFSLREFCEIKALETIIKYYHEMGCAVHWRLLNFSVNTDFSFCGIEKAFSEYDNVTRFRTDSVQQLSDIKIYGFKTDMNHSLDLYVDAFISCVEIATCKLHDELVNVSKNGVRKIVLGNIKINAPVEDFQVEIFDRLARLPYHVIVVPRHPLTTEELGSISLPKEIDLRNTMGELESLQASADLTIMGRIFSKDGLKPDDDHNPLEATINSNSLCGVIKETPEAYKWLYSNSGLIHQCESYDEVFSKIDQLISDSELSLKLEARRKWILMNRKKYLSKVKDILGV